MVDTRALVVGTLVVAAGLAGCLTDLLEDGGCGVTEEGWPGVLVPADAPADAPHHVRFQGEDPCLVVVGKLEGTGRVEVARVDPARDVDVGPIEERVRLENATGTWRGDGGRSVSWTDRTVEVPHGLQVDARLGFSRDGTHFLDTEEDAVSLGGGVGEERIPVSVAQPGTVSPVPGPDGENGTLHLEDLDAIAVRDATVTARDLDVRLSNLTLVETRTSDGRGTWTLNGEPIEPVWRWTGEGQGRVADGVAEIDLQADQGTDPGGRPVFGLDLAIQPPPEEPVEMEAEQGSVATERFRVVETSGNGAVRATVRVDGAPQSLDSITIDVCREERPVARSCTGPDRARLEAPPGASTNVTLSIAAETEPGAYTMELVLDDGWTVHERVPIRFTVRG